MLEVKREAAKVLLQQDEIFSGLKDSSEVGSTEQHLIDMLTSGGFSKNARWGRRSLEPKKAVICSLALAKLKTEAGDENGNASTSNTGLNAKGMAQKLLLFWRKPARRCWWEGVQLDGIEGINGSLKVWIRRVWTLEMYLLLQSVIGLR
ncbi:GTPase-activating protein S13 [Ascosphaera pollenicola]|nr:GTPase-activating protein S13 [Ascosphaera pollenicola]